MSNVANNDTAATMARIAELEAMQAELKALKAKVKNTPRLKVSTKGAISVYGLQRMPVTLYAGQWERIIELVESGVFADFIAQNEANLTRKGEAPKTEETPAPAPKATKKGKKKTAPKSDGPTDAELNAIDASSDNARSAALAALSAKVDAMTERSPAFDIFED